MGPYPQAGRPRGSGDDDPRKATRRRRGSAHPQYGEAVTEATVTRWLKREGEPVEADEPLLEIATDLMDFELPSPVTGILSKVLVAEDETVAVGTELAIII